MMNTVIVFEVASSRIAALAAKHTDNNTMQVLSYHTAPSADFIYKGRITNISKAEEAVKQLKHNIETDINAVVTSAVVVVNDLSVHSQTNVVSETYDSVHEVNASDVASLDDKNTLDTQAVILNVISQEYRTDGRLASDVEGQLATNLTGSYVNILINKEVINAIQSCFDRNDIEVVELCSTPEAAGYAVLRDGDKQTGCALVDIGAELTSVSIYRSGKLLLIRNIPIGSASITRDICKIPGVSLDVDQAEQIKYEYGACRSNARKRVAADNFHTMNSDDDYIPLPSGRQLSMTTLVNYTAARSNEIANNVMAVIKSSGLLDNCPYSVVLIGGGSLLKYFDDIIAKATGKFVTTTDSLRSQLKLVQHNSTIKGRQLFALFGAAFSNNVDCISAQSANELPLEQAASVLNTESSTQQKAADPKATSEADGTESNTKKPWWLQITETLAQNK